MSSASAVPVRTPAETPQGGLSLVEGSIEVRRKVFNEWSGVVFVDAGVLGGDSRREIRHGGAGGYVEVVARHADPVGAHEFLRTGHSRFVYVGQCEVAATACQ